MNSELLITEDGSNSLYVPEIDECYHSSHGAIQESRHIFIEAGLKQCRKSDHDRGGEEWQTNSICFA